MARPKKQTVDYFPHDCITSRSLGIIQTQHGNDGYAFWFKLLQLLGKTEAHFFDYNNRDDWLFLLAETHVPDEKATQILETLASVGSIDKELWKKKIIWSQHFVDNVADVYMRRKVGLPTRPGSISFPLSAVQITQVSGDKRTIKEMREEEQGKISSLIKYYEDNAGRIPTPADLEKMIDFSDTYPEGWFEKAVDELKKSKDPINMPMRYIEKIMENWKAEGVNPFDKRRTKAHKQESTTTAKLKEGLNKKLR